MTNLFYVLVKQYVSNLSLLIIMGEKSNITKNAVFSGHETFQCKSLWLKKGYDFVKECKSFNDEDAVVTLGVGKNMVSSIKYWLKSFGIIDDDNETTEIGDYIFGTNGCDPFLEDENTLWLLHYLLVSLNHATLYNCLFLKFHKERNDFSKQNVFNYIKRQFEDKAFKGVVLNENTINKDITTLLKLYVRPSNKNLDDFSSVLLDLNLITRIEKDYYEFNSQTKAGINPLIFLYAIKDIAKEDKIVEFDKLLNLSLIFCLSQSELYEIFNRLNQINPHITFDNSAGEQLFAINDDLDKKDILDLYYKDR